MRSLKWAVLGRDRSLPHLERKFYHLLMGAICFSLHAFVLDRTQAMIALASIGGAFVLLDLFRLCFPKMNALTLRMFGKIMRREELKSISGNSFYILGLMVVLLFFPKPIVLLSVAFLALGDPVAAVVGTLYGRHKLIGKKSLEGALANFALSWLAVFFIAMFYFQYAPEKVLLLAWVGAFISMVAELIPLPVDDNFTIPVFSAVLLTMVNAVVPLF